MIFQQLKKKINVENLVRLKIWKKQTYSTPVPQLLDSYVTPNNSNPFYKNSVIVRLLNSAFQSVVFNSGQKMALRAFYFRRALTKAYYYINRSQRHLLAAIENN